MFVPPGWGCWKTCAPKPEMKIMKMDDDDDDEMMMRWWDEVVGDVIEDD